MMLFLLRLFFLNCLFIFEALAICDERIDTGLFFQDMNKFNPTDDARVKFSRVGPSKYVVAEVQILNNFRVWQYFQDYLVDWPTWSGIGVGRIREVRFENYGEQACKIVFVSPHNQELYKADYRAQADGIDIFWQESQSKLRRFVSN